jgi:hypothetical protein
MTRDAVDAAPGGAALSTEPREPKKPAVAHRARRRIAPVEAAAASTAELAAQPASFDDAGCGILGSRCTGVTPDSR